MRSENKNIKLKVSNPQQNLGVLFRGDVDVFLGNVIISLISV